MENRRIVVTSDFLLLKLIEAGYPQFLHEVKRDSDTGLNSYVFIYHDKIQKMVDEHSESRNITVKFDIKKDK